MGSVSGSDRLPQKQGKTITTKPWPSCYIVQENVAKEMTSNHRPNLRQIREANIERSQDACGII